MLGARDTYLDRLNSTVVFRSNRTSLRAIEQYVRQMRAARAMLIYEVHVYQVDLTDDTKSGINWNRFGWTEDSIIRDATGGSSGGGSGGNTGGSQSPPTGDVFSPFGAANRAATLVREGDFGIGAVFSGPNFNAQILLNFLRSQGTVRVVSQPRIGMMSGSRGSLQVTGNNTYVAKVGTNIGTNLNQVTVETETLRTGFELTLFGLERDGVIFTDINLSISELLRFTAFTALGTELQLPQTSSRDVKTNVAARPGDVILLAGISVARDNADVTNAAGGNSKETQTQRGELVIALRPKVVRFVKRPVGSAALGALPPAGDMPSPLPTPVWVDPGQVTRGPVPSVMPPSALPPAAMTPNPALAVPVVAAAATATSGGISRAQFGAYRSGEAAARAAWTTLQTTHPGLRGMSPEIVRETFGDQPLWLLRSPAMDRDSVQRLCSDIRRAGDPCAVVRAVPVAAAPGEGG
jgi:hypothetical protein